MLYRMFKTNLHRSCKSIQIKKCHSVMSFKALLQQEKVSEKVKMFRVQREHHETALRLVKEFYLKHHVFVRAHRMNLHDDRSLDQYLIGLFKQGNTLIAKTENDTVTGFCVGYASSRVDPNNLRSYAFYRQDPNTKDFFYFTAKLQETPNLWDLFKQQKIYEIKMLAVLPEYRRQGLAVTLLEKSKEQAHDQGFNVVRMDCINPYDYKVAEHCMMQCIMKYPLHKLRGPYAPFIKRSSAFNCLVRVYVDARELPDVPDIQSVKQRRDDLESLIE